MLELLIWAARHDETAAPCGFVEEMEQNRQAVLDETYRRWKQRHDAVDSALSIPH